MLLEIQNNGVNVTFFFIAVFLAIALTFSGTIIAVYVTEKKVIAKLREKGRVALEISNKEISSQQHLHKQKELEMRNRITRDLHDDIGASLSSVKAYSELLKNNPNNPAIAELIRENASDMIEQLEVILWATNPQFDAFESLQAQMQKYAVPLLRAKAIAYHFSVEGLSPSDQIPAEIRQNIFLIFKEAINNIIKYSSAKNCFVSLCRESERLIFQIRDDGTGINEETKGTGNGIYNMKKRALELQGELEVISAPGEGTLISISCPML